MSDNFDMYRLADEQTAAEIEQVMASFRHVRGFQWKGTTIMRWVEIESDDYRRLSAGMRPVAGGEMFGGGAYTEHGRKNLPECRIEVVDGTTRYFVDSSIVAPAVALQVKPPEPLT